jgi:hypothetical protein
MIVAVSPVAVYRPIPMALPVVAEASPQAPTPVQQDLPPVWEVIKGLWIGLQHLLHGGLDDVHAGQDAEEPAPKPAPRRKPRAIVRGLDSYVPATPKEGT